MQNELNYLVRVGNILDLSGSHRLAIIGSRRRINAALATIEKISRALDVPLHDMLEMKPNPPKSKPKRKSKAKKKKS